MKEFYKMKMITLLVGLIFVNNSYARSSGPTGFGMEIDRESFGGGAHAGVSLISEGPGPGWGRLGNHELMGVGGSVELCQIAQEALISVDLRG